MSTIVPLPSSAALTEKTDGFCADALVYLIERFSALAKKADQESLCQPMVRLLEQKLQRVLQQERARTADTAAWAGEAPPTAPAKSADQSQAEAYAFVQQRDEAEQMVRQLCERASTHGVQSVRVHIALSEIGQVLVSCVPLTAGDAALTDPEIKTILSTLINESMFVASGLLSRAGQLFQASSRTDLLTDAEGQPLPGTLTQIEHGLAHMQRALNAKHILCDFIEHSYAGVSQALAAKTKGGAAGGKPAPTAEKGAVVPTSPGAAAG